MKRVFLASLTLATLSFSAPAFADEAERLALARRIISTRQEDVEMQFFDATLPYYMAAIEQTVNITEAERDRMPDVLREEYRAALLTAREHTVLFYARIFAEEDLRSIAAFWESAAGRSFIAHEAEIQQDNIDLQNAMNAAVLQNALERTLEARNAQHF
jgi:hypothetical protein